MLASRPISPLVGGGVKASAGTGVWSGPTRTGEFGTPSLFLIGDSSIQLASDGRSQALAIWPKREGKLAGRWITLDDMRR